MHLQPTRDYIVIVPVVGAEKLHMTIAIDRTLEEARAIVQSVRCLHDIRLLWLNRRNRMSWHVVGYPEEYYYSWIPPHISTYGRDISHTPIVAVPRMAYVAHNGPCRY